MLVGRSPRKLESSGDLNWTGWFGGWLVALMILVAVLATGATAASGKPDVVRPGGKHVGIADPMSRFVPGEILVRFRSGVSVSARNVALEAQGATLVRELLVPGLVLVRLAPGQGVAGGVDAFSSRGDVVYAEPNWIYRASAMPNDPRFTSGELWGLHNTGQNGGTADADIDAPEAWDTTTGSTNVVVAVVDTGVAYDHPDLGSNMWSNPGEIPGDGIDNDGNGFVDDHRGWDFIGNDNDPRDGHGHGTHVAGTIGAKGNNAIGVVGVNWNVTLMPVQVLGADGSGTNESVTNGFAYAAQMGAKIVNASLGGGGFSQSMKNVIDGATSTTLFVVAAGNDGRNNEVTPQYPCNYTSPNLVCVAATNRNDGLASFSNFGTTSVDLGAPGVEIVSTWPSFESKLVDGFETDTGWVKGVDPTPPPFTACTSAAPEDTWARTMEAAATGSWSATDSPGGNYVDCQNNWFRAPAPVSLSGAVGCNVEYAMRLQTESFFDWFVVDASANGGASWTQIGAWTGSTGASWFAFQEDLSAFDGQPSVLIRFGLESDESVTLQGAHIDNVNLQCVGSNYTSSSYNSISGTSMATPHVAGVAALAWAKNPAATVAQVKTALLDGGDSIPSLAGKTVTGRRLNAAGTLALIPSSGYMLTVVKGGNGNGTVTGTGINCGSDCTETYAPGTEVELTATPQYASNVAGWTNCDAPSGNTCTMTMDTSKTVTVTFTTTPTFADVPPTNPFYHYIEELYDLGITTGCGLNGSGQLIFCPGDFVPRQQMAAFLIRAKGLTQLPSPTPTFADVPMTNPFYGYIERLYEQGITTGCGLNGSGQLIFCPGDFVPRQQMAAFLIRAFA